MVLLVRFSKRPVGVWLVLYSLEKPLKLHIISGDNVPATSPVKDQFLDNFGNVAWKFATGSNGNTFLRPKEEGFLCVALIYR